jgi:DNA-binding MarR family transcriptional regulator
MSVDSEFQTMMREWVKETTNRSMRGLFHYAKENGLSMPQVGALFNIRHNGGNGVADLGDELRISSAAASQMLDRLVQQGLVSRSENPDDRRSKRLSLTDRGEKILLRSVEARQLWIDKLENSLSAEEIVDASRTISLLLNKTKSIASEMKDPECGGKGMTRT